MTWRERNRDALSAELDEGERLLAAHRVVIRSATNLDTTAGTAADPELDPGLGRTARGERLRRRAAKGKGTSQLRLAVARELGLPVPGAIFILGLSDQRLLFWKASIWLARPGSIDGSVPIDEVSEITVARRLGKVRAAILLSAGPLLVVQPLWERALEDLESAYRELRAS